MDPLDKASGRENPDSDAYIGMLLYKTGRSVKRALSAVGSVIASAALLFWSMVLFLVRHLHWLILGTVVGWIIGGLIVKQKGTQYFSELTLKTNFNSSRSLYNNIDYFNALIATGKIKELSRIFDINDGEARAINGFSAEPVESEMITATLYRDQFINYDRSYKAKQDTFWLRTIDYGRFKNSLTKFDYPFHIISVTTNDAMVFSKLQTGLITTISDNKLLQETKQRQIVSNKEEEQLLSAAVKSIDTLRKAYTARIGKAENPIVPANQLTMVDNLPESKIPELEVYDKMLELQDELKNARKKSLTENEIIEVISSFSPVGKEVSILKQKTTRYAVFGLFFSTLIVTIIAIVKARRAERKSMP